MKPVLLALSTFRYSQKAIDCAIEETKKGRNLIVVYVVDVNLARYFIGADLGFYENLKEKCGKELLQEHKKMAKQRVESIAEMAEKYGIEVKTHISIGRFALKVLPFVKKNKPEFIITTRSKRPKWVKKFFGSPVDYLVEKADCPVVEA
jgi:nucleotide-binding universal stress UspA family protein